MTRETHTGAKIVLMALKDQGVDVVFGYPGGVTLPLYDEIYKQNFLRHILVRHEQGAVHAAEGYARSTGKVGCVLVTSGPGATNTVTGLTDALMDSVPLVCLTGQVPTALIGNDAFQEADTTGITRPCTKHNYLVRHVDDLARVMHEAFYVARTGRPGPVVVDLPKDVILALGEYMPPEKVVHKTYRPKVKADPKAIEAAVDMMASAKRPILYGGGGVINAGPTACKRLVQLTKLTNFPITLTLMGLGAVPASNKNFLGMPGMHGTVEANMAMHDCDVMINVGARFDDRVTGRLDAFAPKAKKIHIDIDPSSINKNVAVELPIIGDAGSVLGDILKLWKERKVEPNQKAMETWWKRIERWRARDCLKFGPNGTFPKPQYVLSELQKLTKGKDVFFATDVGQHQMWAAQYLPIEKPFRWLTSGGLGTMGYGLPAAMGVQAAHPDKQVVVISSDGSFQMNLQEIATLCQYKLPVKMVLLNNKYMGMIRQWQELFYDEHYSECRMEHGDPDFVKLADAYGILGLRAEKPDEVTDVLKRTLAHDGPVIADICTDPMENVYPMVPSGAAHNEIILGPGEAMGPEIDEDADVVLA